MRQFVTDQGAMHHADAGAKIMATKSILAAVIDLYEVPDRVEEHDQTLAHCRKRRRGNNHHEEGTAAMGVENLGSLIDILRAERQALRSEAQFIRYWLRAERKSMLRTIRRAAAVLRQEPRRWKTQLQAPQQEPIATAAAAQLPETVVKIEAAVMADIHSDAY